MRQQVARGNIQPIRLHSLDGTALAIWAHAAPSKEYNCIINIAMCVHT